MTEKTVSVSCRIDRRTFARFAAFDSFVRKKAWRNPLLFALLMAAFAAVCFLGRRTHEGAVLLAGVLLGVGLLLPLLWVGMFFSSVRAQARRSGLSPDREQYRVALSPQKIEVSKGKERAEFDWQTVHMAVRRKDCIYLYVSPARAFLLPEGAESEPAWSLIREKLDPARIHSK